MQVDLFGGGEKRLALFGKKVEDAEWRQAVSPIVSVVADTCDVFERAGSVVQADPITGWASEAETLGNLKAFEVDFEAAKRVYKSAGKPEGTDMLVDAAKKTLDEFFSAGGLAFHWGKFHFADASGGPGQRAVYETGFAQRAALVRVGNNGRQFAENALKAAQAGRAALASLSVEPYGRDAPGLADLFVEAAQPGTLAQLSRRKGAPLSQVANFGSWCYSRAAILGMIVQPSPLPFLAMVWNPERIEGFWALADAEASTLDRLENQDTALGYFRLLNAYSELYGEGVFVEAIQSGRHKDIERLADSQVSALEVRARWAMDAAAGLGLGIRRPDFVRQRLEVEAHPDVERWRQAHQAGLDIPAEPDAMSAAEQIDTVIEACEPFFVEYYAEASQAFVDLTLRFAK